MIELLVTLVVLGVALALAVPSFSRLIAANRLTAQADALQASLQYTRSEAIRRNAQVSLCPTTDGTSCYKGSAAWTRWIVMVVSSGEVLRDSGIDPGLTLQPSKVIGNDGVVFHADGLARDSTDALLVARLGVCMEDTGLSDNERLVSIASGSRISVSDAADTSCAVPSDA